MRFSEAINKFSKHRALEKEAKTVKGYDLDLRQFCVYLRNPLVTQIMIEHLDEYLSLMKELGWSPNSLNIKATCFSQFFKFWKKKGYPVLDYELIPHVKREYVPPKVADHTEFKQLINSLDREDQYDVRNEAMIRLLADTGMRNSEICDLPIDISTEPYEIFENIKQYSHVIKTKKSRGRNPFRRVFWYEETNEALKRWIKLRNSLDYIVDKDYFFVTLDVQGVTRGKGKKVNNSNLSDMLRKLSKRAGLDYTVNAHSFRHKFGNDLAGEGMNNSTISDLMGHASLSSSFIYTHLNDDQMKKAHIKVHKKLA